MHLVLCVCERVCVFVWFCGFEILIHSTRDSSLSPSLRVISVCVRTLASNIATLMASISLLVSNKVQL